MVSRPASTNSSSLPAVRPPSSVAPRLCSNKSSVASTRRLIRRSRGQASAPSRTSTPRAVRFRGRTQMRPCGDFNNLWRGENAKRESGPEAGGVAAPGEDSRASRRPFTLLLLSRGVHLGSTVRSPRMRGMRGKPDLCWDAANAAAALGPVAPVPERRRRAYRQCRVLWVRQRRVSAVTEAFPGFAGFRDEEDAPFFRSAIRAFGSPEATAAEVLRSFSRVVFAVMDEASRRPLRLEPEDLLAGIAPRSRALSRIRRARSVPAMPGSGCAGASAASCTGGWSRGPIPV
jgi:hypothetical protein